MTILLNLNFAWSIYFRECDYSEPDRYIKFVVYMSIMSVEYVR